MEALISLAFSGAILYFAVLGVHSKYCGTLSSRERERLRLLEEENLALHEENRKLRLLVARLYPDKPRIIDGGVLYPEPRDKR